MKLSKPNIIVLFLGKVPSIIKVVAAYVSEHYKWVVHIQHEGMSHHRGPRAVQLMTQLIQQAVVFPHIFAYTARSRDLI